MRNSEPNNLMRPLERLKPTPKRSLDCASALKGSLISAICSFESPSPLSLNAKPTLHEPSGAILLSFTSMSIFPPSLVSLIALCIIE